MTDAHQTARTVYIVSDSTGETAATMVRAALVQYKNININIVRYKNIRTENQVDSLLESALQQHAIIIYTIANQKLRMRLNEAAGRQGLPTFDLLGPLLDELNRYFEVDSHNPETGVLRAVNEKYFRRIEAIEYTVKHDDGKDLSDLSNADILLVGISRTSKTPLSIFLSHKGWKVVNIPLVLNQPIPEQVFKVDQRRVVGLTIDPQSLHKIRRNRLEKFGQDPGGEYASHQHILDEISYADEIFKKNRRWPVFNVTERALEETAAEIVRLISSRLGLEDSVLF